MFLKRSYKPEIMDDFSIQDERIDGALNELKITNKMLGGISVSKSALKCILKKKNEKTVSGNNMSSVLDVGAGASDILINIKNKFPTIEITGIDLNKRTCRILKNNPVEFVVCSDALRVPFKKRQFDIIHASLFFHHFNETEIEMMLNEFLNICSQGLIINDLRRSILALAGIKIIALFFSKSALFKNDGPLSVKRGFIKKDWLKILDDAGIKNYKLKRKWAFRWMLVIYA